jgi:acyl carrier protein
MDANVRTAALSAWDRAHTVARLVDGLRALLADAGKATPPDLDETTPLIGPGAVLSSLELVSLIVEMEQTVEDECGLAITIADERAMSRQRSPFRTIGTLAEYVLELVPRR